VADIGEGSKSRATYRAALAAVIILSVLLAAAIVAVVFGFIRQYRLYSESRTAAANHTSIPSYAIRQLTPGARVLSATDENGKLVLRVATPQGNETDIFDRDTRQRIQQIKDGGP
jgi:hypothetical protein